MSGIRYLLIKRAEDPSMAEIIRGAQGPEDLLPAIERKIKTLQDRGEYFQGHAADLPSLLGVGPTVRYPSSLRQLVYKATNALGLTDKWPSNFRNVVTLPGMGATSRFLAGAAGVDPDFIEKRNPGYSRRLNLATAAHEILEKERLDAPDSLPYTQSWTGGAALGSLAGIAAGARGALSASAKQRGAFDKFFSAMKVIDPKATKGLLAGAAAGALLGLLRGGRPTMPWSSHASPDIVRHEGVLVKKMGDPDVLDTFKALRARSGEIRGLHAMGVDYGDPVEDKTPGVLRRLTANPLVSRRIYRGADYLRAHVPDFTSL